LGADSTHFNMIYCSLSTGGDSTTNTSTRTPIPMTSSFLEVPGKTTGTQGPSWNMPTTHRLVYQIDEEKMMATNPAIGSSTARIISSTESIEGKVCENIHNARLKKWYIGHTSTTTSGTPRGVGVVGSLGRISATSFRRPTTTIISHLEWCVSRRGCCLGLDYLCF